MIKHFKRTLPLIVVSSLVLTGCFKKEEPAPPPPPQDKPFSISELKEKYGSLDNKDIMPLYNVSPNEEFSIQFKSFMGDIATQDILSVHTEPTGSIDSRVEADVSYDSHIVGATTVKVKPSIGVLNNKKGTWGNASMLYLRLDYDLDAENPTKLDKPIIIPFTLKSSVKAPNVQGVRAENGNVELRWSEVQGADSYLVYAIKPTSTDRKVTRPTAMDGFRGYEVALLKKTKDTKFSDWETDGKNGVYANSYKELVYQNKGFKGDYFVVALDGKKQSLASTIISSSQFLTNTPYQLVENINGTTYESIRSLPKSVTIELLDGSVTERKVIYDTSKVKLVEDKPVSVPYKVFGSVFGGSVVVDKLSDADMEILSRASDDFEEGYLEGSLNKSQRYVYGVTSPAVFDNASDEEKEELKTDSNDSPKDSDKGEDSPEVSEEENNSDFGDFAGTEETTTNGESHTESLPQGLFMLHKDATDKIVVNSDKRKVIEPAMMEEYGVSLSVNSALEEYLGLSILNGVNEISLSSFPSTQTYMALNEVMGTLLAQNPLLLGVKTWTYDYGARTLIVDYTMTAEEIRQEQIKLLDAVKGYLTESQVTTLSPDSVYDKVASMVDLATKVEPSEEESSSDEVVLPKGVSDATGVWVYGQANSLGFAKGYKLLADMTGVESIVVRGEYNLKPHWWNKVKSDGQWLNVDVSLNDKTVGIPYKVYLADDYVASQSGLTKTGGYWYSEYLLQFSNEQGLYDYYARNGLMVDSVEAYAFKLKELLESGKDKVIIRMDRKLDSKRLYDATGSSLQQVVPDKLKTARFTESGNFVVLDTTPIIVDDAGSETVEKDATEEATEVDESESGDSASSSN